MKRILVFSLLYVLFTVSHAFPCFSPTDMFAAEVILNKPGISYDLERVWLASNVSFENGAFIYRSHFDKRVAAILEEVDETQTAELLHGLSVRIQIPTRQVVVDGEGDLVEAVEIKRDSFDFGSALRTEIEWLSTNRIVNGVYDQELMDIAEIARAGLAGWNSRIVYEDGRWLPYSETSNPSLIRGVDCGGFALEKLSYDETILLPAPNSVSLDGKLATKWGRIKATFSE